MKVNNTVSKTNKVSVLLYGLWSHKIAEIIAALMMVITANNGFLFVPSISPHKPYLYKKTDTAASNENKPIDKLRIKFFLLISSVLRTMKSRQRIRKALGNLDRLFVPCTNIRMTVQMIHGNQGNVIFLRSGNMVSSLSIL